MKTLKLILQYDGTEFSGWQTQPGKRTVQATLEAAFKQLSGHSIAVVGAGRTDAGVHALAQVAHIHLPQTVHESFKDLRYSLNSILPPDLGVLKIEVVSKNFHAIRSAKKKTYLYQIWNSPIKPVLERRWVWPVPHPLDVKAMKKAARHLLGKHDFRAFEGAQAGAVTKVRTLYRIMLGKGSCRGGTLRCWPLIVGQPAEGSPPSPPFATLISIEITGNGFLKHMVRNIVGTLVEVGLGKRTPQEMKKILQSKDRRQAGQTAPAQGLLLKSVNYGRSARR